jgi:hypothetical protein
MSNSPRLEAGGFYSLRKDKVCLDEPHAGRNVVRGQFTDELQLTASVLRPAGDERQFFSVER